jgi:hypothetical protein
MIDQSIKNPVNDRLMNIFEKPINTGLKTISYLYVDPYDYLRFIFFLHKQFLGKNGKKMKNMFFVKIIGLIVTNFIIIYN